MSEYQKVLLITGIRGILRRLYEKYGDTAGRVGIELIVREGRSGIVKDVTYILSEGRVVYDFDLLGELVEKFGGFEEET